MSTTTVGFWVSIATVSLSPVPALPTTSVNDTTSTEPSTTLSWAAVKVAVAAVLSPFQTRADRVPPRTSSTTESGSTASENVKVTLELSSPSFSALSTMSTTTVGFWVYIATVSLSSDPDLPTQL